MDPLSITATCIGLASTITRSSLVVIGFVKDVRAARSDLDVVSRELLSLKTVLELLADDIDDSSSRSIPQTLQNQIAGIVRNCTGVVVDIEQTLKKHEGGKVNKAAKWVTSGKSDVSRLQLSLEAHKSALEIALDMVTLTLAKEIKADTQEILNDTSAIKEDTSQIPAIREDTALILAEIARLQEKLPRDGNQRSAGFMLERYLDNLTSYAETVVDTFSDGSDGSRPTSRPGSSGRDMVLQTRIESIESEDILQPGPGQAFPARPKPFSAPPKEREHIQRVSDTELYPVEREHIQRVSDFEPYPAPPKEREHIQRASDFEPYPALPKEREHIQRASDFEPYPALPKEREHIQRASDFELYLAPPKEYEHIQEDIQRASDFELYLALPKEHEHIQEHIQRASDAEKSTEVDRLAHTVLATHTKRISGLNKPSRKIPRRTTSSSSLSRDSKLN